MIVIANSIRFFLLCTAALAMLATCGGDRGGKNDPIDALPTDATRVLSGLPARVRVVFDDLGMPHVYAPDVRSAIFTQGYLTASVRFWEMDAFRRVAEGRLSEILGPITRAVDVERRTVFTTRDGRRLEDALWEHIQQTDSEVAALLQAYTDGVNAWLNDLRAGRNGAAMPPEYTEGILIRETPETLADWRPQDITAIARLQAHQLSDTLAAEINLARVLATLPEPMFRDIFRSAPAAPTTILPPREPRGPATAALPRDGLPPVETLGAVVAAMRETRAATPLGEHLEVVGSNNWVIAPQLSVTGHAMLANDPHLALFNPPIWHMIQLNVEDEDLQVTGVMFPGLPGVILGHNAFGAWGATTAAFDVLDVYVEHITTPEDYPASPRTVRFRGTEVPVLRIEEPFVIKGRSTPVTHVIEVVPHHGPMVPDPNIADGIVGIAATGMSFRWTGHEITNDPRFLLDLLRSRTARDFRRALRSFAVGAQNWIWADISGDIDYFARALIPQRPAGVVPFLPLPGTGEAEWITDGQGNTLWLPEEKIPQARNPARGFVASANNDHVGNTLDNDPLNDEVYLSYSAAPGFRAQRIEELLTNAAGDRPAGTKMSVMDMMRYQYDHQTKEAERLVPFLLAAAERRPDLITPAMQEALDRLRAWGEPGPGSPAYDAASGVDAHDLRADVPARSRPVSEREKADAVAMSIFAAWSARLSRLTFRDDFDAFPGIGTPGGADATKALLHLLEDIDRTDDAFRVHTKGASGESWLWDNRNTPEVETRDEILLAALQSALSFLADRFRSAEQSRWLWGLIHQVNFQHFVGQAGITAFDLGPFPAPGGRFTVNPAGYSLNSDSFIFSGGASQRFVALLDPDGIRSFNILPGGNNGNPGRPAAGNASDHYNRINPDIHYGDHIGGWINGEVFEYRVEHEDVAENATRKIVYLPGPPP